MPPYIKFITVRRDNTPHRTVIEDFPHSNAAYDAGQRPLFKPTTNQIFLEKTDKVAAKLNN